MSPMGKIGNQKKLEFGEYVGGKTAFGKNSWLQSYGGLANNTHEWYFGFDSRLGYSNANMISDVSLL